MRVLAVNGSPRKNGNTYQMLNDILKAIGDGVEKELIHLKDYNLNPYDACYSCMNGGGCHISKTM